jgi:chromate transporter
MASLETRPHPSFNEAVAVWARVAVLSFGGPAGQIATMHRIIVEEKRWIGEARFLHALSFCMLLPGPEAQQLAIMIGWLMHRTRGGVAAGVLFVLPGLVSIMALSMIYAEWGRIGAVSAAFFGLKAAVLAIVAHSVLRVGRRALRNRVLACMAAAAFAGLIAGLPFPAVILAAGLTGWVGGRAGWRYFQPGGGTDSAADGLAAVPRAGAWRAAAAALALWLLPVAAILVTLGPASIFCSIALFFSKMAVVGFGGAYAVLAYVAQYAVEDAHWLRPGEMLDGLGLAETTPGPLILVTQFVGFLAAFRNPGNLTPMLAGILGGLLTSWVTFAPCFLWVFAGAPFIDSLRANRSLTGALSAITAAVVGVMLNLAVWFTLHVWFGRSAPVFAAGLRLDLPVPASLDPWALALSLAAMLAIFRFKAGMIPTLLACAAAGVGLHLLRSL